VRTEELPAFFEGLDGWARARGVPVETLAYGEHPDQVVELRLPATPGPHALALVLHGGFWRAGYTRRNTSALAVALAESGWASANVEYRRLGPGAYRPMLDDVAAARRALEGFESVVAIGHSAGARAVQELLGGDPAEVPDAYLAADPAERLPLRVPQVLVHGVDDDRVPLDHVRAYANRAQAAGDDCRVVEVDAGHFEPIDPRSPVWPAVVGALALAGSAVAGARP
jgi:acetyl esterase/lipase